jgi:hypothetical protein
MADAKEKKAVAQKGKTGMTLPTEDHFRNAQLDLFQSFLCNTEDERDRLSNTIDLWDSLPKYAVSRQAMTKLRKDGGFLELLELEFKYKSKEFQVVIQPAHIKDHDGVTQDYYPAANEELVEDALRKIATDQDQGYFDGQDFRSGVVFSLYMLRKELAKRGHTRSYQEIIESLRILSGSMIEIRSPPGGEMEALNVGELVRLVLGLGVTAFGKGQHGGSSLWRSCSVFKTGRGRVVPGIVPGFV